MGRAVAEEMIRLHARQINLLFIARRSKARNVIIAGRRMGVESSENGGGLPEMQTSLRQSVLQVSGHDSFEFRCELLCEFLVQLPVHFPVQLLKLKSSRAGRFVAKAVDFIKNFFHGMVDRVDVKA